MTINPAKVGIHHITLRCTDADRTKAFYKEVVGLSLVLDTPELFGYMVSGVFIGFKPASPKTGNVFDPFHVGLDHIAIACDNEQELHQFAGHLEACGVENTGVKTDPTLMKLYVAFKDPDRIQWEYYMT